MPSMNPVSTTAVAAATGRKWCQSCATWAAAEGGSMRRMRSRHGYALRFVCGSCTERRRTARAALIAQPTPEAAHVAA
jgi:RNase P subunit RPR2